MTKHDVTCVASPVPSSDQSNVRMHQESDTHEQDARDDLLFVALLIASATISALITAKYAPILPVLISPLPLILILPYAQKNVINSQFFTGTGAAICRRVVQL